jgi:hypothetical protein
MNTYIFAYPPYKDLNFLNSNLIPWKYRLFTFL